MKAGLCFMLEERTVFIVQCVQSKRCIKTDSNGTKPHYKYLLNVSALDYGRQ